MNIQRPLALLGLVLAAAPALAAETRVDVPAPFAASAIIADNIKSECSIGNTLVQSLQAKAGGFGQTVVPGATGAGSGAGRSLQLEIVEAQSAGNAFSGHFKSAAVRGVLFENGQQVATVTARRVSRGGAFAGFKGSCQVLDRTVNRIGEDLAQWLANPTDNAKLGDF